MLLYYFYYCIFLPSLTVVRLLLYIYIYTFQKPSLTAAENGQFSRLWLLEGIIPSTVVSQDTVDWKQKRMTQKKGSHSWQSYCSSSLLCWDKATSKRVWSWQRRNGLSPVLSQFGLWCLMGWQEGQSLWNSLSFPKEPWKGCAVLSPPDVAMKKMGSPHSHANVELPEQLLVLFYFGT